VRVRPPRGEVDHSSEHTAECRVRKGVSTLVIRGDWVVRYPVEEEDHHVFHWPATWHVPSGRGQELLYVVFLYVIEEALVPMSCDEGTELMRANTDVVDALRGSFGFLHVGDAGMVVCTEEEWAQAHSSFSNSVQES